MLLFLKGEVCANLTLSELFRRDLPLAPTEEHLLHLDAGHELLTGLCYFVVLDGVFHLGYGDLGRVSGLLAVFGGSVGRSGRSV